jgi:protein-S-isoprenylcysteine O-methyltransferase Ste14
MTRPVGAVLLLGHWVIAGLDIGRFHWSPVPWAGQLICVIGYGIALVLNLWAMRVNRYYSSVVRIQSDRGHRVIDRGPYQFVRHPGYMATILAIVLGGLALGSWWALVPSGIFVLMMIRRASVEDRMLQSELPGYLDYSQRVRWRLVPGLY